MLAGDSGNASPAPLTRLYRNNGDGTFTDVAAGLPALRNCAVAWGDYDNDGDLDLLLSGNNGTASLNLMTRLYRNDAGAFADVGAGFPGLHTGAASWGDYDNDGRIDILLTGYTGTAGLTRIYRNTVLGFTNAVAGLPTIWYSTGQWGDYNNDGDLDFVLAGTTDGTPAGILARVYASTLGAPNTVPTAPTGLTWLWSPTGDKLTLIWNPGSDAQTPVTGLSYNLRIGTSPGSGDILSAMASSAGFRHVPEAGNAQKRTSWTLTDPPGPGIHWSVQTIDGAYAGSAFTSGVVTTGVEGSRPGIRLALQSRNPVIGIVTLRMMLPASEHVRLTICDIAGRQCAVLYSGLLSEGTHSFSWRPRSGARKQSAAVYFARLMVGSRTFVRKLIVLGG